MWSLLLTLLIASDCFIRVDEVRSNGFQSGEYLSRYYYYVEGEFQFDEHIYFTLDIEHQFKKSNVVNNKTMVVRTLDGVVEKKCYYIDNDKLDMKQKISRMLLRCLCSEESIIEKLLRVMGEQAETRRPLR